MMKHKTISLLLLSILLAGCAVQGATDNGKSSKIAKKRTFEDLFVDQTLRIDYYRIGNRQSDSVLLAGYRDNQSLWAGSLTQLIDPFNNGHYRIEVRDLATGEPLYSRCFNSIFQEYCSTPAGADSTVRYEEVAHVPMPKIAVMIVLQERGKDQLFHTQAEWPFDPNRHRMLPTSSRPQPMGHRKPQRPEVVKLQSSGDVHHKLDIAIVPEGYGPDDSVKMMHDFQRFVNCIFLHDPFKNRRNDINLYGVKVFGKESGITDPTRNRSIHSAVGASYNTFGAERYLMTFQLFQLHDCLAGIPFDQIIIMANSDTYGGGAIYNFYAISSLNKMAENVLTHELGHAIGGLADEYVDEALSYGDMHSLSQEPLEPNITTLVNFESKWKSMMATDDTLGTYEGAGYHTKGIYRPYPRCMMRDYAPFCPVCAKRLNEIIDLYTK